MCARVAGGGDLHVESGFTKIECDALRGQLHGGIVFRAECERGSGEAAAEFMGLVHDRDRREKEMSSR